MESLTTVFAILGTSIGIIAALAAAYVWFRNSADKATITAQGHLIQVRGEEIADLRRRVQHLENENDTLKAAVAQVRGVDKVQATADAIKADTTAIRIKVGAP